MTIPISEVATLNLYLLERTDNTEGCYDIVNGAVVAATNISHALEIMAKATKTENWPQLHSDIEVTCIGTASSNMIPGVILYDFRAG